MSNRELAKKIIDRLPEDKMIFILNILENIGEMSGISLHPEFTPNEEHKMLWQIKKFLTEILLMIFYSTLPGSYQTPEKPWKNIRKKGGRNVMELLIDTNILLEDSRIHEQVVFNEDGSFTVLINSRTRNFAQLEAYRHAIAHIMNHDFDKPDADAVEAAAHEGGHSL